LSASLNGRDFWWGHQRKQTFNGRDYYFYRNENRAYSKALKLANGNEVSTYTAEDLIYRSSKYHVVADPVSAGNDAMNSYQRFLSKNGGFAFFDNSTYKVTSQTHYAFPGDGNVALPSRSDAFFSKYYNIPVNHVSISDEIHYYMFKPTDLNLQKFIDYAVTPKLIDAAFNNSYQNGNFFRWLLK
jgi:hypothetical protein